MKRKKKYKITKGKMTVTLYKCNPELNTECDKKFCKHNKNAIKKLCDSTLKEEFALNLGQKAKAREYTPGQKN